jgi:hypothetical protein
MSYADVICLTFAEIVGDFGYKEFANKGGIKPFAVGTVGYIGVIYFLHLFTLRGQMKVRKKQQQRSLQKM